MTHSNRKSPSPEPKSPLFGPINPIAIKAAQDEVHSLVKAIHAPYYNVISMTGLPNLILLTCQDMLFNWKSDLCRYWVIKEIFADSPLIRTYLSYRNLYSERSRILDKYNSFVSTSDLMKSPLSHSELFTLMDWQHAAETLKEVLGTETLNKIDKAVNVKLLDCYNNVTRFISIEGFVWSGVGISKFLILPYLHKKISQTYPLLGLSFFTNYSKISGKKINIANLLESTDNLSDSRCKSLRALRKQLNDSHKRQRQHLRIIIFITGIFYLLSYFSEDLVYIFGKLLALSHSLFLSTSVAEATNIYHDVKQRTNANFINQLAEAFNKVSEGYQWKVESSYDSFELSVSSNQQCNPTLAKEVLLELVGNLLIEKGFSLIEMNNGFQVYFSKNLVCDEKFIREIIREFQTRLQSLDDHALEEEPDVNTPLSPKVHSEAPSKKIGPIPKGGRKDVMMSSDDKIAYTHLPDAKVNPKLCERPFPIHFGDEYGHYIPCKQIQPSLWPESSTEIHPMHSTWAEGTHFGLLNCDELNKTKHARAKERFYGILKKGNVVGAQSKSGISQCREEYLKSINTFGIFKLKTLKNLEGDKRIYQVNPTVTVNVNGVDRHLHVFTYYATH